MAEGEGHRENETKPGLLGGTLDSQRLALRGGRRLGRRIRAAANTSDLHRDLTLPLTSFSSCCLEA
jgi:hypothetical protein